MRLEPLAHSLFGSGWNKSDDYRCRDSPSMCGTDGHWYCTASWPAMAQFHCLWNNGVVHNGIGQDGGVTMTDSPYIRWLRTQRCLLCDDSTSVAAAHIRYGDLRAGKPFIGLGMRSGDWALPLCGQHHRLQHMCGERNWWASKGIDPVKACAGLRLAFHTNDIEMAEIIFKAHLIEGPDGHR
jgi:hypothetical protein